MALLPHLPAAFHHLLEQLADVPAPLVVGPRMGAPAGGEPLLHPPVLLLATGGVAPTGSAHQH
jgi:hypothetical protein